MERVRIECPPEICNHAFNGCDAVVLHRESRVHPGQEYLTADVLLTSGAQAGRHWQFRDVDLRSEGL